MWSEILWFLQEYTEELGSSTILAGGAAWLWHKIRKPKPDIKPEPKAAEVPPKGINMDAETFADLQKKLLIQARADLAAAHGEERKRLEEKIDALNARLANPDEALAQQHAIILDLEAQLARRGNDLGGDDVATAKAALESGDFTAARALFETLAARTEPDVQAHADASFALGQIAEAEIRWHDAAIHYARAARLDPTFETLRKASDFAERAGNFAEALRYSDELLALARKQDDPKSLLMALNEHAINLKAQGRYPEAEGLFRQALDIDRKTIGDAHPEYATHLNNLASVVRAQGRYPEAEGLYRQALDIDRKTIGDAHPDYAIHLNNLAGVVQDQGRYPEAEGLYRQAITILRDRLGDGHPNTKSVVRNLIILLELHNTIAPDLPELRALRDAATPPNP